MEIGTLGDVGWNPGFITFSMFHCCHLQNGDTVTCPTS